MSEIDVDTTRDWIAEIRSGTNAKKGRGLEDLVQAMCATIPGLEFVTARKRNLKNTAEIDLVFGVSSECPIVSFGRALVFECKNQGRRSRPIRSQGLRRSSRKLICPAVFW